MSTDHNEAMRLADRISPETDWYEFDQVTWCNEAAALLRQQAEQIDAELCNREVLDKMLTQCIAERDQLRAEVERLKPNAERWEYAMDWGTSGFAVCRRVGATGTCWEPIKTSGPLDAARTTHKETE